MRRRSNLKTKKMLHKTSLPILSLKPTVDNMECEECIINIRESLNHKNYNVQECSQCDYETKCETAFKHTGLVHLT